MLKLETLKSRPTETFLQKEEVNLSFGNRKNVGDLIEKAQLPTRVGYVAQFVEINSTL